jgi:hypothetical protein
VPPLLAALLVLMGLIWINTCHPKPCHLLRAILKGMGIGAVVLSLLALMGVTAPQLMPLLCVVIILLAIAVVIGSVQKCF